MEGTLKNGHNRGGGGGSALFSTTSDNGGRKSSTSPRDTGDFRDSTKSKSYNTTPPFSPEGGRKSSTSPRDSTGSLHKRNTSNTTRKRSSILSYFSGFGGGGGGSYEHRGSESPTGDSGGIPGFGFKKIITSSDSPRDNPTSPRDSPVSGGSRPSITKCDNEKDKDSTPTSPPKEKRGSVIPSPEKRGSVQSVVSTPKENVTPRGIPSVRGSILGKMIPSTSSVVKDEVKGEFLTLSNYGLVSGLSKVHDFLDDSRKISNTDRRGTGASGDNWSDSDTDTSSVRSDDIFSPKINNTSSSSSSKRPSFRNTLWSLASSAFSGKLLQHSGASIEIPVSLEPIIHTGWVYKLGGEIMYSWKYRYLILRGDFGFYYDSEEKYMESLAGENKPSGWFSTTDITNVTSVSSDDVHISLPLLDKNISTTVTGGKQNENVIKLITVRRDYYFYCPSPDSSKEWIDAVIISRYKSIKIIFIIII